MNARWLADPPMAKAGKNGLETFRTKRRTTGRDDPAGTRNQGNGPRPGTPPKKRDEVARIRVDDASVEKVPRRLGKNIRPETTGPKSHRDMGLDQPASSWLGVSARPKEPKKRESRTIDLKSSHGFGKNLLVFLHRTISFFSERLVRGLSRGTIVATISRMSIPRLLSG